jgi:small subunit ribosomal protein S6
LREYETTFIVQPEISEEGCQELFDRLDGVLERAGAVRLLHDDQGKRRLAYEIQKFQKGRYVTTYYLDEGPSVAPFEQRLRLEESVLRFLTVLKDEEVADVEARKTEAAEQARLQAERAKERAVREAEEEKARQEAAREAAAEAARRAEESEKSEEGGSASDEDEASAPDRGGEEE